MSSSFIKQQWPECEAMKRKAHQKHEKASKYTSLGKLQLFNVKEKEKEISRFYGYVM
jgi:hypothetical protein